MQAKSLQRRQGVSGDTHEELVFTFGVRQQNGWKAIVNEFFTVQDCEVLFKLYKDVYVHPPPNGDYLATFCVVGWHSAKATQ